MGKVLEIGISYDRGSSMQKVDHIDTIKGKGLVKDRHFKENNEKKSQITLVEIENINSYNKKTGTSIQPIDFRRNIITEGIRLNDLVGKEFFIGKVKLRAHDLCRPCRYLEKTLNQKDLVKEFLFKGGLRCEILSDGKISIGDLIND